MAKKKTRSEEESYRVLFFVISSLMMLSTVWLVYQEFFTRRPWKEYQTRWFTVALERAKTNLESEKLFIKEGVIITKDDEGEEEEFEVGPRIVELNKLIADLEGGIVNSPKRIELGRLKSERDTAEIAVKDAEIQVAFTKAAEDEYYYYYRRDKHHDDAAGEAKHQKRVEEIQADVAARQIEYDAAVKFRDGVVDKLNAIRAELAAAKKELADLSLGLAGAQRAYDTVPQGIAKYTSWEILQHWNQDIELVDRCHTCHMGIDKCGFSAPREILADAVKNGTTQAALRKTYCITRQEAAAYFDAAESIVDSFGEDEELSFDSEEIQKKLKLDVEPVLVAAKTLGMDAKKAEQLFRTHPQRTELLRKHPGGKYGCTTCHYGQGRQTKPVGLNLLKGFGATREDFDHAERDHYWLSQLLRNEDHHTEASCFNCHKTAYELDRAPHLTEARKFVQHLGCTGCHPLGTLDSERKHGPQLVNVGTKIDTGWLLSWIEQPKAIRPRTRMPNFWPEAGRDPNLNKIVCNKFDYERGAAISPAVPEDCTEKRDREVAQITAFLLSASKEQSYPTMPAWADAAKGKEVFESVGCIACHNLGAWDKASHLAGSADRDLAPNLTAIGDKIIEPGWFFAWVKDPKAYWHETRMPQLRLSDDEAWNVAAYLSGLKSGTDYAVSAQHKAFMETDDAVKKGEALVAWYGCFGCHDIDGFESRGRIGAELTDFGSKPPHKLDFGDVPRFVSDHHAQTWEGWLRTKVEDPRGFRYERVETRMPQFDLSPQEVDKVVLFLKGQNLETEGWPDSIRFQPTAQYNQVQRGALLVDQYNCRGCHQIDQTGTDVDGDHRIDGGAIYAWFAEHPDEKFRSPPKLMNQGRKVYPDWFYAFLKNPTKLRENFKVRMPTFQLSDSAASDIVAYFAAKAGSEYPFLEKKVPELTAAQKDEAKQFFVAAQCLNCHVLDGKPTDPKAVAPSLRLTAERLQYDWLFDWFKDPSAQQPGVAMPGFFVFDEDTNTYSTPLPQFAGGDYKKQIDLLRAYVISLGADVGEVASAPSN